ncbi:MAG: sigma-70 family RNA polymerase sigma factor [Nannocystaceae bacterium]|nr:sigma-70 family RNA polymerase sigma factor [bacterium]
MSELDDVELVRLALGGDAAARRELARRLMHAVAREVSFAVARLSKSEGRDPKQEVRDLVHEVLLGLFEDDGKALRRWDPDRGRSLESFVQLIARRRVPRMLSGGRGNPWADAPIDPTVIETADDADLAQRLEQRDQLDQVLGAVYSRMNERDHELFDLVFIKELASETVAEQMEMTRGAVNAWAYRVRKLARTVAIAADGQSDRTKGTARHG